ncbi:helix-turn-helix domain-containing protein [Leuconostoc mesenteroides]
MFLGEKIKLLRKEKKITQRQLAEELFISYQSISNWERNVSHPTTEILLTIIEKYNLPLDFFIEHIESVKVNEDKKNIMNSFLECMIYSHDVRPTIDMISNVSKISKLKIKQYFPDYEDLVYEFINSVDHEIKIKISQQVNQNKDIIGIFIEDMAPLLYKKREELRVLYTRPYIKIIWLQFIKSKYKNILKKHNNIDDEHGTELDYIIETLTGFINVWLSQGNPESLVQFQNRIYKLTSTTMNRWIQ